MARKFWLPVRLALRLLAGACLLLSACRVPAVRRSLEAEQMAHCPPHQMKVREQRNALVMRFDLAGLNGWTLARWDTGTTDKPQAARMLRVRKNAEEVNQLWRTGQPVAVFGPEVWQRLVQAVAADTAPAQPNQGTLLLVSEHEVIACRDPAGAVRLLPLERRPRSLRIVRTLNESSLANAVLAQLHEITGQSGSVLLATGQHPAFVYFRPSPAQVVFLHPPAPETTELPLLGLEKLPPDFSVRTMLSLGWRSSLFSALNNPGTFLARGISAVLSFAETLALTRIKLSAEEPVPPLAQAQDMDLTAWERELNDMVDAPPFKAALQFQIDGEEFFLPFIQALQDARESIDLRMYIFDNDDYAVKIADILRGKSRNVRVRVMHDELGSLFAGVTDPDSPSRPDFVSPGDMTAYLKRGSRVHVRPLANPWLTSSHTKSIIIDGQRAWIGGMNIGREYRYDWHDLMVEITGPLVTKLQRDFSRSWSHNGPGGDLAWAWQSVFPPKDRTRRQPLPAGAIEVRPLYTKTWSHEIERTQVAAIRRAQRRIWIENAYFTDDRVLSELIAARRRGVDVRVILPAENDMGFIAASNLVTVGEMLRHGIRVYAFPGMAHVKAALFDGWACVGSANFDRLSLRVNRECNLAFSDPDTVRVLERRLFQKDFAASKELTEVPPVSWSAQLVELLANQL